MKTSQAASRASFSLKAPAKINWFLKIIGKRVDGYHDIASLMQCISLYDNLKFEHSDSINVISDLDIPLSDNIVYKAASLLKKLVSYRKGAKITLKKRIPVSAGLGGGSSDAACVLSGLNMLWGLNLSAMELSSTGAEIGSDVPFFFNGPLALVEGRGEKATPFRIDSSITLLLVKPPISVSTAWAYSYYDKNVVNKLTKKAIDIKLFCQTLKRQDYALLGKMLDNDFEDVVTGRYPVISEIKLRLIEKGALISAMSGSGPTVFGVFESRDLAKKAAGEMKPNTGLVVETLASVKS